MPPGAVEDLIADPHRKKVDRVMTALLQMGKIEVAEWSAPQPADEPDRGNDEGPVAGALVTTADPEAATCRTFA